MSKLFIERKYGQTPNELLNSSEISLKAKGMFGFLQSKPNSWSFSNKRISQQIKEGRDSVRSTLQELERYGYLKRTSIKRYGKFHGYDYFLYEKSLVNPLSEKPVVRRPRSTETQEPLSKKESSKKEVVIKKDKEIVAKATTPKASYGRTDINLLEEKIEKLIFPLHLEGRGTRNYLKNFLDSKIIKILRDAGIANPTETQKIDGVIKVFQKAGEDSFHRKKITSLQYIYNHTYEIINSANQSIKIS